MEDIKFTGKPKEEIRLANRTKEGINENVLAKKSKKLTLFAIFIILIVILALNKDAVISEYNKLFSKTEVSEDKSVEKTKEPPKEESNFIKDTYLSKIDKTQDILRKANLRDIKLGLEFYFAENGSYPISLDPVRLNDANSPVYNDLIKYVTPSNLRDPKDPEYFYFYKSDGKSFELSARLENLKDPECEIADNGLCIYKTSGTSVK